MINIDYYPPFMQDVRQRYTCGLMCDHLCNKWKSIINEKQKIIDLTNEYLKNKYAKKTNEYSKTTNTNNTNNTNEYVDISEFANKYNELVDIYNNCIDSLNDTIYHILHSPESFKEYYTEIELKKIQNDLNDMFKSEKMLKRSNLMLINTRYKLSQELLDILNSVDKLIEEIIIDIMDMTETTRYLKFDPFEKIMADLNLTQVGGVLTLSDVKDKINLIEEKIRTLLTKASNATFLQNHTSFKSLDESIEMLDKLNLQISSSKFKNLEIGNISKLQFPEALINSFTRELGQSNFSINFDYNDFDIGKIAILQQKIDFLKQVNTKIQTKIATIPTNFDKFGINITYLPSDIKYEDDTLKNEYDEIIKKLKMLEQSKLDLDNKVQLLNPAKNITLKNLIEKFDVINSNYYNSELEATLSELITLKTNKASIVREIKTDIERSVPSQNDIYNEIFSILTTHEARFTNGAKSVHELYDVVKEALKPKRLKKKIQYPTKESIKNRMNEYLIQSIMTSYARLKFGSGHMYGSKESFINAFMNFDNLWEQLEPLIKEIKDIDDSIAIIEQQIMNVENDFFEFLWAFGEFEKSDVYKYLNDNYPNTKFTNVFDDIRRQSIQTNLDISKNTQRMDQLKDLIGVEKPINKTYFRNKLDKFNVKINAMRTNINKTISSINKFLPDDERIQLIDTTVDMWYKQSGGTITSDKTIITEKIQQFSQDQLNMLEKVKELSEEMRIFRFAINDYLKVVVLNVKHELQVVCSMIYLMTIFNEVLSGKFQVGRTINYSDFKKMKTIVLENTNQLLKPIKLRMINLCEFIENDFKQKQQFSLMIDETNKLFIDLVTLSHFTNV